DSGRFWFSRVRTAQLMRADPTKRVKRKQDLVRLPYTAWRSDTTDTWRSLTGKGGRRVSNQDVKVVFKGSEDEAEWKRAGSPDLAGDTKARSAEGTPQSIVSIDNPGFTWSNVAKLPTGKAELEAKLKGLYPRSQSKERGVSFAGYLWATGADLLTAPITPGTRSALFEVLADSASGLKSQAGVKDALGRTGVALETTGPDDAGRADRITYRLIFDDKTGAGLELSVIEEGVPLLQQTFQSTGYVDKLGDTPQR
ncbi:hypothetical protein, partial [Nonomuraea lactucae]|uniref:hypothetical protein n=1 Tax=Nonomuraea lactucae TaxID=2249762 RepID=UPI001966AE46